MSEQTFQWTGHRPGKCRQIVRCQWFPEVAIALKEEQLKLHHNEGRVYLDDGSPFSAAKQRTERRYQQIESKERSLSAHPEVQTVLHYMNALPPNLFTKQARLNLESAVALAQSILDPTCREIQLRNLAAIRDQPQPFYSPSMKGNTDRIFAGGNGLTALRSDIRKKMCAGWSEADLSQCQLAIIAKEWGVPGLEAFLRKGGTMWTHLIETIGNPPIARDLLKGALKEPLYSLTYGMRASNAKGDFTYNLKWYGIENGGARVFVSPLIQELIEAREQAAARIRETRGGATCFDVFLPLGQFTEYQILSIQAQAIEMSLLLPVIDLAKETNDFTVTLWQHDGIAVNFTRRRNESVEKINRVVKEKTDVLGIHTSLEWEHPKTEDNNTPHSTTGRASPYLITNRPLYVGDGRKGAFRNLPRTYCSQDPTSLKWRWKPFNCNQRLCKTASTSKLATFI